MAERGVALWQLRRTREEEERRDREYLLAHIDRVKFELRDNAASVKQLQRILEKSPNARVDLFRFAARLAAALPVSVYEDLARSGLERCLSWEVQSDLFDARQRAVGLYNQNAILFKSAISLAIANNMDLHNASSRLVEGGERARADFLG